MTAARVANTSSKRTASNAVRRQLTEGEQLSATHIKDMGVGLIRAIEAGLPEGREREMATANIERGVAWAIKGLTA